MSRFINLDFNQTSYFSIFEVDFTLRMENKW